MPTFKRQRYSGICICGHSDMEHHGNMVLNPEAFDQTGEARLAGECEFYGWNECTDSHCPYYWDRDNPEPEPAQWAALRPSPDPSVKVGGCPGEITRYSKEGNKWVKRTE